MPYAPEKGTPIKGASALILGITFKENCPDIRNTRAIDLNAHKQTGTVIYDVKGILDKTLTDGRL